VQYQAAVFAGGQRVHAKVAGNMKFTEGAVCAYAYVLCIACYYAETENDGKDPFHIGLFVVKMV
jgi:hypothetical protein